MFFFFILCLAIYVSSPTPKKKPSIDPAVSFLQGAVSDDAASVTRTSSVARDKNRPLSMMKKKPGAKKQRSEILLARQGEVQMLRARRKAARLAARRSIPAEILASAAKLAERDALANGLNDLPAAWEHGMEEEDCSSVEFECMSRAESSEDDDISFNLNSLVD
jgi:hypothetical protein